MAKRTKPAEDPLLAELEDLIPRRVHTGKITHLSIDALRKVRSMALHGMFEKRIYGVLGVARPTWQNWKRIGNEFLSLYEQGTLDTSALTRGELTCLYISYTLQTGMPEALARVEENLRKLAEKEDHRNIRAIELYLRTRDPDNYNRQVLEHHHVQQGEMTEERKEELTAYLGAIFRHNGHGKDEDSAGD